MAGSTMDHDKIERGVRLLLEGMGEDPTREGLVDTPARVARAFEECCGGLHANPKDLFDVSFDAECHDVVAVRDIPFYSICEHHLLPFYGVAHVAYVPGEDGRVCGISKLARLVELYARRPQLQERLTAQVADALQENLSPEGVLVVVEAEHMCMTMRGVAKPGSRTTTMAHRGCMDDEARRSEVLALVGGAASGKR